MPPGLEPPPPADNRVAIVGGGRVAELSPPRPTARSEVLLEVRGVRRLPDVKEASFVLHAGEVLGIAGLFGAGRSELLRAVHGVARRDAGEVVLEHYGEGVLVREKADASPVTAADEAAEAVILARLAELTPEIAVVATKTFTTQVTTLVLLAAAIAKARGRLDVDVERELVAALRTRLATK